MSTKPFLLLDGKSVAKSRLQALAPKIEGFQKRVGRAPCLAVVLVGADPASAVYVRNKVRTCQEHGIESKLIKIETCTQAQLDQQIVDLNQDEKVDGILVQLPLPKGLSADRVNHLISPHKDVDGFSFARLGYFYGGDKRISPCTPKGIMSILEHYQIKVSGKNAVVVGRSLTVGRAIAELLLAADATVTICHSKTSNLSKFTREADLVVVAAGKREFLGKEDFKQGAVVIDVGIHGSGQAVSGSGGSGKKLAGDVRFEGLEDWVSAATPVPGGVGPMTIVSLLENLMELAALKEF